MSEPPPSHSARDEAYAQYVTTKIGDVAKYDEASLKRFARAYESYLRDWLPSEKDARILDAGCGHGNMLYALRAWGYVNVTGVDRSGEQVALARAKSLAVVQGDALCYLVEHLNSYDLILAIDLFEHLTLEEALQFLKACRAALRERGRLVMQMPNAGSIRGGELVWGDITHCRAYSVPSLQQMLKLSGFREIAFRETGPVVLGVTSLVRWLLWRVVRAGLRAYDVIETGRTCPVLTRTLLVTAGKGSAQ